MRTPSKSVGDVLTAALWALLRGDLSASAMLLAHEQSTPDLTLYVEPGTFYVGNTRVVFAGGNSPTFTAPAANPRIDLLTIDSSGTLARTAGSEAASPSVPTYPTDKIVLYEVYNRVGQTTVRDTDTGSNGYIYRDVRGFLNIVTALSNIYDTDIAAAATGALLYRNGSSKWASLAIGAESSFLKVSGGIPSWATLPEIFGGDGTDGALSISSGTTTLNAASASVLIKNYTSISITGTAKLTISNPNTNGTKLVLRSQGDVTITAAAPAIDLKGMGAQGGGSGPTVTGAGSTAAPNGNQGNGILDDTNHYGVGGTASASAPTAGTAGAVGLLKRFYGTTLYALSSGLKALACGSAGGSGSGGGNNGSTAVSTGGNGGAGGGCLLLECAGDLNFTTALGIDVSGAAGTAGTDDSSDSGNDTAAGAGGGGGSCGMALILYRTATATSGTVNAAGGAGGKGGDAIRTTNPGSGTGAPGAGGGGAGSFSAAGGAGSSSGAGSAAAGVGAGGGGGKGGYMTTTGTATGSAGGSGGATDTTAWVIAKNVYFG